MKLLKLGVFLSMLLMTPVLEAQNKSVSLWEENIEQLSKDEEEKNWEDELEELSNRLQEPVNINVATKRELEQFPFLSDIQIENILESGTLQVPDNSSDNLYGYRKAHPAGLIPPVYHISTDFSTGENLSSQE